MKTYIDPSFVRPLCPDLIKFPRDGKANSSLDEQHKPTSKWGPSDPLRAQLPLQSSSTTLLNSCTVLL